MRSRSETFANVSVGVMCLTVALVVGQRWQRAGDRGAPRPNPYLVGERTPFTDARANLSDSTILIIVSSSCRFCTDSLPFYKNLIGSIRQSGKSIRTVAVSLDPPERGRQYLSDGGVEPDDVIRMPGDAWRRIQSTPTILLVDREATVKGTWVGKLNPDQEEEVRYSVGLSRRD